MGDSAEDKTSTSGNISNEEELVKSVKIDQSSEEKIVAPKARESSSEKIKEQVQDEKKEPVKEEKRQEVKENSKAAADKEKPKAESDKEKPKTAADKETPKTIGDKNEDLCEKKESDIIRVEKDAKKTSDSVPCCPNEPREKIIRNQSDIFSLKDVATTLQTSIFSVNGSPSRRVFRKQEPAGHVFQNSRTEEPPAEKMSSSTVHKITRENYNDEKRPSSSYRNPLTGTGLSSNDEYKSKGVKRKDGNPLLGLGYDSEVTSSASQHRIPPGGYSHKLW